jgi:prefoldin subunit 5
MEIDENHSYIQPRLALIQHLTKYGIRGLYEPDLTRSKDKTTHMIKTWMETRAEESRLRRETLNCITFTTKGKIEVHDSEALESLNTRISAFVTHREAIEAAIERLSSDAPMFLCDLLKARDAARLAIEEAPRAINHQLGIELKEYRLPVETAMKSHRYLKVKEAYEASAATAKARLEELEPQITLIEEQLTACEKATIEPAKQGSAEVAVVGGMT